MGGWSGKTDPRLKKQKQTIKITTKSQANLQNSAVVPKGLVMISRFPIIVNILKNQWDRFFKIIFLFVKLIVKARLLDFVWSEMKL